MSYIKYSFRSIMDKGCVLPNPNNSQVNVRSQPDINSAVVFTIKQGQYSNTTGDIYSNVLITSIVDLKKKDAWIQIRTTGNNLGYVHVSVVTVYPNVLAMSARNTASVINKTNLMLSNDEKIRKNIVSSLKKLVIAKKANRINNVEYVSKLKDVYSIYTRWQTRQNFIKSGIAKGEISPTIKIEDKELAQSVQQVENGIGAIPVIIIVIILVAALSVTGTLLVMNAIEPKYSESEVDLKKSALLEKALSNLTPEEQQEVVNDLEKQVDDAYGQGVDDGNSETLMGTVKTVGIALISIFLAYKGIEWNNNRKKTKKSSK